MLDVLNKSSVQGFNGNVLFVLRWGLRVAPVLGIVTVIMTFFFLLDPPRGLSDNSNHKTTSWSEDIRYLMKQYNLL